MQLFGDEVKAGTLCTLCIYWLLHPMYGGRGDSVLALKICTLIAPFSAFFQVTLRRVWLTLRPSSLLSFFLAVLLSETERCLRFILPVLVRMSLQPGLSLVHNLVCLWGTATPVQDFLLIPRHSPALLLPLISLEALWRSLVRFTVHSSSSPPRQSKLTRLFRKESKGERCLLCSF